MAKIENGVVTQVIVTCGCDYGGCDPYLKPDDFDHSGCGDLSFPEIEPHAQAFVKSIGLDGEWRATHYEGAWRGKYAGQGDRYDAELDEFVSPVIETPQQEAPSE